MVLCTLVVALGWVSLAFASVENMQERLKGISNRLRGECRWRRSQTINILHESLEETFCFVNIDKSRARTHNKYEVFMSPKEIPNFDLSAGIASTFEGWDDSKLWFGSDDGLLHGELKFEAGIHKDLSRLRSWAAANGFIEAPSPVLYLRLGDQPDDDFWLFMPIVQELKSQKLRVKLSEWFNSMRLRSRDLFGFLSVLVTDKELNGKYRGELSEPDLALMDSSHRSFDKLQLLGTQYPDAAAFYIVTTSNSAKYCIIEGLDSDQRDLLLKFLTKWTMDSKIGWRRHLHSSGRFIYRRHESQDQYSWLYLPHFGLQELPSVSAAERCKPSQTAEKDHHLTVRKDFQPIRDTGQQWVQKIRPDAKRNRKDVVGSLRGQPSLFMKDTPIPSSSP